MGIRKIPVNFGKIEDDLSIVLSNSQPRFSYLRKNKQAHPFPQQEVFLSSSIKIVTLYVYQQ